MNAANAPAVKPAAALRTVTPDVAIRWLENANPNNRAVSDAHVARLARDMSEGRWILTHEGIAFDPQGRLLDGQHRLWAVIESNQPVEMHVFFNLTPEALMVINTGKPRSLADVLRISGSGAGCREVSVLRAMLGGLKGPAALSGPEAAERLKVHHCAIDFALSVLPRAWHISDAITRAVMARAYYSADRNRLAEFGRMMTSGVVPQADCTSVILLRQYLQANAGWTWSERRERYAKTERALASYLKGQTIVKLYAATQECFPLPEEGKEGHGTHRK